MNLHNRIKENEFKYTVADSQTLACKIWGLANNWEALLIRDHDHQNKKQVINAMMLMIQILLITVFLGPFWSIMSFIPQNKGRNYSHQLILELQFNNSCKIFHKTLFKNTPIISGSVKDSTVLKSYLCFHIETTENLEIKYI